MTEFKVGDRVRVLTQDFEGEVGVVTYVSGVLDVVLEARQEAIVFIPEELELVVDAVNPSHYMFPGGVEVHQISGYLTSFAGQALQYIARSCRIDGNNKSEDPREDIEKAIEFLTLELERINR